MNTVNNVMAEIGNKFAGTMYAGPSYRDALARIVKHLPQAGDGLTSKTDAALNTVARLEKELRKANAEVERCAKEEIESLFDSWTGKEIFKAYADHVLR